MKFVLKTLLSQFGKQYRIERGPEFADAMQALARPSEVTMRADAVPNAVHDVVRGLFCAQIAETMGDWIWPAWMVRQSDPASPAYAPQMLSVGLHNITARNWTALPSTDGARCATIDDAGMLTPTANGWSIDVWAQPMPVTQNIDPDSTAENTDSLNTTATAPWIFPSRLAPSRIAQHRDAATGDIITRIALLADASLVLVMRDTTAEIDGELFVVREITLQTANPDALRAATARIAISLRPFNIEGPALLRSVAYNSRGFWNVEGKLAAAFSAPADLSFSSTHAEGDAARALDADDAFPLDTNAACDVGLATAVSVFELRASLPSNSSDANGSDTADADLSDLHGPAARILVMAPMVAKSPRQFDFLRLTAPRADAAVQEAREPFAERAATGLSVTLPDASMQRAFDASRALLTSLKSDTEIFSGPTRLRTPDLREETQMIRAVDTLGFHAEAAQLLDFLHVRQWDNGYYCTQRGEWDSPGRVLHALGHHARLAGQRDFLVRDFDAIRKAGEWIERKRHDVSFSRQKPRGLLPAGFGRSSAAPNDYFFSDNFWNLAGLDVVRDATDLRGFAVQARDVHENALQYRRDILSAVQREVELSPDGLLPASPRRTVAHLAIENLCALNPLRLFDPIAAPWLAKLLATARESLLSAETRAADPLRLLRRGFSPREAMDVALGLVMLGEADAAFELWPLVASAMSPTGAWPELVMPGTHRGIAGDAHSNVAAAACVQLVRGMFVSEDAETLSIGRGLPSQWFAPGTRIAARNISTHFGIIDIAIHSDNVATHVTIDGRWRSEPETIRVTLNGHPPQVIAEISERNEITIPRA